MSNTLLSPTIITREALRILHANLNFIGNINRQYDDRFANSGASPSGKIGPNLTIRMPNRFGVRTGATMTSPIVDIIEESQTLTVSTIKGVDFAMSQSDLTLTVDQFSDRYLKPAMARLASEIESDAISMYKDVYNFVDDDGSAVSFLTFLKGGQLLDENLAPDDGDRVAVLTLEHNTKLVDALKGLFNPQSPLGENFRKGEVANNTAGWNRVYRNSILTAHTTGTAVKGDTGYTVNDATAGNDGTLTVAAGATTFAVGDIITFDGCNAVHPETKVDLGYAKQFVVTVAYAGGAGELSISPTVVVAATSAAKQNVTAYPTNGGKIYKVGAGASGTYKQSLGFHKDAFTFVTADLVDPSSFGAKGAREVQDGISMTLAQQYVISDMSIKCRLDVLYGKKCIRPELAVRMHADG